MKLWGGFVDGCLHWQTVDDGFGGEHNRLAAALFITRKEAREQYQDVRRVEIKFIARAAGVSPLAKNDRS